MSDERVLKMMEGRDGEVAQQLARQVFLQSRLARVLASACQLRQPVFLKSRLASPRQVHDAAFPTERSL